MVIMTWACDGHMVYHDEFQSLTYARGEDYFSRTSINTVMLMVFPENVGYPYGTNTISQVTENVAHWTNLGYRVIVAPYMPDIGEYDLEKIRLILLPYLDLSGVYGIAPTGLGVRGGASPTPDENHQWLQMMAQEASSRGKICMISNGDWQSNIDCRLVASYGVIIWAPYTGMWRPGAWDYENGVAPELWVYSDQGEHEAWWYASIWRASKYPNWDNIKAIVFWTTLTKYHLNEPVIAELNRIARDFQGIEPYPIQPPYPADQPTRTETFDGTVVPSWMEFVRGDASIQDSALVTSDSTSYYVTALESVQRASVSISADMKSRDDGFTGLVAWYNYDAVADKQYGIFFEYTKSGSIVLHVGEYHWSYSHVGSASSPYMKSDGFRIRMDVQAGGIYPRDTVTVRVYVTELGGQFNSTPHMDYIGSAVGLAGGKTGFHTRDAKSVTIDNVQISTLGAIPTPEPEPEPSPTPTGGTWGVIEGTWYTDGSSLVGLAASQEAARVGYGNVALEDFTVTANLSISDTGSKCAGIYFRFVDADNYYFFRYGGHDGLFMLYKMVNGQFSSLGHISGTLPSGAHEFKVVVAGTNAKCYVDGALKLDRALGGEISSGGIGFEVWDGCSASFSNIQIDGQQISIPSYPRQTYIFPKFAASAETLNDEYRESLKPHVVKYERTLDDSVVVNSIAFNETEISFRLNVYCEAGQRDLDIYVNGYGEPDNILGATKKGYNIDTQVLTITVVFYSETDILLEWTPSSPNGGDPTPTPDPEDPPVDPPPEPPPVIPDWTVDLRAYLEWWFANNIPKIDLDSIAQWFNDGVQWLQGEWNKLVGG